MGTTLKSRSFGRHARTRLKIGAGLIAAALLLAGGACEWRQEKAPAAGHPTPSTAPGAPSAIPPAAPPLSAEARRLTDTARFLAGLPAEADGAFAALCRTEAWKRYAKAIAAQWSRFETGASKMRTWAARELEKSADPALPVFYPFGGPDAAFVDIFVPGAKEAVLVGLEEAGSVPRVETFEAGDLDAEFALYLKSLDDLLGLSFFRTNDMKEDLANRTIDGVVPIMLLLLARSDKQILSVEFGQLTADGGFAPASSKPTAAAIGFRGAGNADAHTLLYISADLYDGKFLKNTGLRKYIEMNLTPCFTFMKSASYLMQKSFFGAIRRTILDISSAVLQDDSAIPYKFYDPKAWDVTLYGRYDGPIKLFKDDFEQELFDAFRKRPDIRPLGFRFGYSPVSCLLLAVKKK
jgi:hypothetical protein